MSLRAAFLSQAASCENLGSGFMGRVFRLLARDWPEDTDLGQLCTRWPGDLGPNGASLPLRIAGGLHALVLTNRSSALAAVYPPQQVADDVLGAQVLATLHDHEPFLLDWIKSAPQTNEVRRSAPLIAAGHWLAARHDLPFVTSELGASAGLNLMWDHYGLTTARGHLGPPDAPLTLTPDWQGDMPVPAALHVAERRGVDLNPINAHDPDQALRLMAYLWPDQPHRARLTRAAIAVQNATVDRGDAIDWLETRLNTAPPDHVHLIYHTIAWQYFPPDAAERGRALIEAAGAKVTARTPLAWLAYENDGDAGAGGAALTLRLWPGDLTLALGRADFHGRWVNWGVTGA